MYLIPAAILLFVVTFGLIYSSFSIRRSLYIKSLCLKKCDRRVVAVTFDDGPDPINTPAILNVLREHNVKATFFLTGKSVELYPELTFRIFNEGHIIGNHSYNHKANLPFLRKRNIIRELQETTFIIKKVTGKTVRLFRPPFGVTNPAIAHAVKRTGYTSVGWSIRSLDTIINSREKVLKRILSRLHNGAVILLHDKCNKSAILLNELLISLKERGFSVETVDQLFNIKAYEQ